jgi:hypothetical protein
MLADDTLRPAEWKKVRPYAKENLDFVPSMPWQNLDLELRAADDSGP